MSIELNGTTGITTPDLTSEAGLTVDGVSFASGAPANTLVTTSGGNVGIGTSSPDVPLEVQLAVNSDAIKITGTSSNAPYLAFENSEGGTPYVRGRIRGASNSTDGGLVFETGSSGSMSERARINSSGSLLVGTTSNPQSARLYVQAIGYNATAIRVAANGNVATSYLNGSGAEVGYVQVNASTTAYVTSSDYRLKEDIAPMTGALAKVAALKPVTYTWKSTGIADEGFIAHELQEVCPSAVTGEKDAVDDNGNPIYQGIDTSFLVATLTAAIQELKAINDAQAQNITAQQTALQEALGKIETLEARVAALEASNV